MGIARRCWWKEGVAGGVALEGGNRNREVRRRWDEAAELCSAALSLKSEVHGARSLVRSLARRVSED